MPDKHITLAVVVRIALREVAQHAHHRQAQEGQGRERRFTARPAAVIEVRSQRFQRGDVYFLDIAEMRDFPGRSGHPLGDFPAQPDDLDLGGAGSSLRRSHGCGGDCFAAGECLEIGLENASLRAAAPYLCQVDARLAGPGADGR